MSDFLRKLNTKTMVVTHICPISLYNHLSRKNEDVRERYDVVHLHHLLCDIADNINEPDFEDDFTLNMLTLNSQYVLEKLFITEQTVLLRGVDGEFYECPIILMTTRISS